MLSPSLPERGTKEIHSLSESARERDRLPFFVVCLLCSMIAEPAEKVNESPVSFRSQPRTVTFYAARSYMPARLGAPCGGSGRRVRV